MEMEYEENFKNVEELHAKQIQDLEASFQHKMMIEARDPRAVRSLLSVLKAFEGVSERLQV